MAFISFLGITLNRRSIIITLLFSELFLFSVTMNLVMTSVYFAVPEGQVLALLFICMAAAESVLGLGLLVLHFKFYNSTS
jgi:NADH:ubiquinone oxidoreductase subunit K